MNEVIQKAISNIITHPDWYDDGYEDGENCWRMDYENVQVQLFCDPAGGDKSIFAPKSASFRLFIENDVRDASGDKRVRYACNGFPIAPVTAGLLLGMGREASESYLRECIAKVKAMPNAAEMCDE